MCNTFRKHVTDKTCLVCDVWPPFQNSFRKTALSKRGIANDFRNGERRTIFVAAASTDVTANEITVDHTIDATTFAVGYGEIENGTKYTTAGVSHSVTESFSVYAGYEFADKTGASVDTTGMSAGLKFKF